MVEFVCRQRICKLRLKNDQSSANDRVAPYLRLKWLSREDNKTLEREEHANECEP